MNIAPTQLRDYLLGAATLTALTATQSDAAVVSVSFGFGPVLSTADGNLSGNPVNPLYGVLSRRSITVTGSGTIADIRLGAPSLGGVYQDNSLSALNGGPVFFPAGTMIGGGANISSSSQLGSSHFTTGLSADVTGFIGFKTTTNNFGYANVTWNELANTLTINSAFVESVAGSKITIPVPEPTALGLLAVGGVVAARRRRKAS